MPTAEIVIHPSTKQQLGLFVSRPSHALLLAGPAGVGKGYLARWLGAQIVQTPLQKLLDFPQLQHITSDAGKAISIEVIRNLEHFLSLRTTGEQVIKRLVIIEDSHLMTVEAQNALLKTLEEPPEDTVIIMTTVTSAALLPTISSRLQTIQIVPPLQKDLQAALTTGDSKQIMALSGGLPGLAFALAAGEDSHPLVQAAKIARNILQQSTFERLAAVDALVKDKQASQAVTAMLSRMAHAALLTGRSSERWQKILHESYNAEVALTNGVQPKLTITNLMLNL